MLSWGLVAARTTRPYSHMSPVCGSVDSYLHFKASTLYYLCRPKHPSPVPTMPSYPTEPYSHEWREVNRGMRLDWHHSQRSLLLFCTVVFC